MKSVRFAWRPLVLLLASAWLSTPYVVVAAASTKPAAGIREFTVDLPVTMDERTIGTISVFIRGTGLTAIDAESWKTIGARYFAPEVVQALATSAVGGKIPVKAFENAGVAVRYDPTRLVLTLEPQRDQRAIESLSLQSRARDILPGRQKSSDEFSAYVNVRALYDYASAVQGAGRIETPRLALDGAARFFGARGASLEWSAFYEGEPDNRWTRGDVRLVHDDPERAIRYSLGDVIFQAAEFQGVAPLLGFSAERRFSELQPWRAVASSAQQSFVLARPSRVTVYLNGLFLRTFQLAPGRYSLTDFTASDGANDVRIEVEDSTGQREVIEFTMFREATLLARGESEFSVNAGVRRKTDASATISYDKDRPAWSGFFRYGLSDTVTVGASYQGERGLHVAGVEGVTATEVGNFSGALNVSQRDTLGHGHAAVGRWSYNIGDGPGRRLRRVDLSAIYNSRNFSPLGADPPDNRFSWQLQSRFTTPLAYDTLATLSAGHARSRDPRYKDESRFTVLLTRRFGTVSASFGAERVIGRENEVRAFLTLSIPLGRQERVMASVQTQDNRRRLEWSHFPTQTVGSLSGSVGVENSDLGNAVIADASYTANRFIANLRQDLVQAGLNGAGTVRRTRVQLETALAFADGMAAIGRPISDSFAIVSRHSTLKDAEIMVNPTPDGPIAIADGFGPALVPGLSSYRPQEIAWDAQELPNGYDLGDTRRRTVPAYRSGVHYQAGSAASVTAVGVAVQPNGSPLSLVAGEISLNGAQEFTPAKVFTNRQGRFVAQALMPGSYTLTFKAESPLVLHFRIDEGASGYVDLGKLALKEK